MAHLRRHVREEIPIAFDLPLDLTFLLPTSFVWRDLGIHGENVSMAKKLRKTFGVGINALLSQQPTGDLHCPPCPPQTSRPHGLAPVVDSAPMRQSGWLLRHCCDGGVSIEPSLLELLVTLAGCPRVHCLSCSKLASCALVWPCLA